MQLHPILRDFHLDFSTSFPYHPVQISSLSTLTVHLCYAAAVMTVSVMAFIPLPPQFAIQSTQPGVQNRRVAQKIRERGLSFVEIRL